MKKKDDEKEEAQKEAVWASKRGRSGSIGTPGGLRQAATQPTLYVY